LRECLEYLEIVGDDNGHAIHVENLEDTLAVGGVELMDHAAHTIHFLAGSGIERVNHDDASGRIDCVVACDPPLRQSLLQSVLRAEFFKGHGHSPSRLINLRTTYPLPEAWQAGDVR